MICLEINVCVSKVNEEKNKRKIVTWNEDSIKNYKEKLEQVKCIEKWKDIKGAILNAVERREIKDNDGRERNKWWDGECHRFKMKLKDEREKHDQDGNNRDRYMTTRREYRDLIEKKKGDYFEKQWSEARMDKSGKKFWELINKQRKRRTAISERIRMEEWISHFRNTLGIGEERIDIQDSHEKQEIEKGDEDSGIEEIKKEEIKKVIARMKKKKAPGEDEIQNEAWIYGGEEVVEWLHKVLNRIWMGKEKIPEEWKCGVVAPVYKKGNRDEVSNYRPITLMDTGYKVYAEILKNKLETELEERKLLSETQFGFRRKKGTIDAIYVVKTALEEEIKKNKGEVFMLFIDLVGAFNNVSRKKIWKMMEGMKIEYNLRTRIKEIYEDTKFKVRIENNMSSSINACDGVRRGCPLSAILFNIIFADLEEKMRKVQEGGIVIGNKKVWTVSYADDIVFLANSAQGLRQMIEKFKGYIQERGMSVNSDKTKIMRGKKAGGRRRKEKFEWNGKDIEEVKCFNYLGYKLQRSGGEEEHIKMIRKKAMSVIGNVWGLAERNVKNSWKRRMYLFDTLVESVIMYGAEIYGWKEYKELEWIQDKYIKWTLKLERSTPEYLLRLETQRDKLMIKTAKRALKYEEKIMKSEGNELLKECIAVKNKFSSDLGTANQKKLVEKWKKSRRRFMEDRGWTVQNYTEIIEEGNEEWKEIIEISKVMERMKNEEKLNESRYAEEYKEIVPEVNQIPEYLLRARQKREMEIMARFRLGTECKANRYWEDEDKKKCRLCGEEKETLKHIMEICKYTGKRDGRWMEQITGRSSLARLLEIEWKRGNIEKERKKKKEEEDECI